MTKKDKAVIALGYFDSVHNGHKKVISAAKDAATKLGVKCVVFSFEGDVKGALGLSDGKCVFTIKERDELIKSLGADEIFYAPVSKEFLALGGEEFLDYVTNVYDVLCFVSGEDYTFGRGGICGVKRLKEYAVAHDISVVTVSELRLNGQKVSTTAVKTLLSEGKVKSAAEMLGGAYFISGKVIRDRGEGRKMGFPTVNIIPDAEKSKLKNGVYKGHVFLDKRYSAIINYGARPTFGLNDLLVETHIIGYDGDLYGENIKVYFDDYLRDIKKFSSEEELKAQLKKDKAHAQEGMYD